MIRRALCGPVDGHLLQPAVQLAGTKTQTHRCPKRS